MKMMRQLVTILMISVLIGMSAVGIFGLSSARIDNEKVNVALVNEDVGAMIEDTDVHYGDDFIKLFVQNKDANYEVTTKSLAMKGLGDGKYDLLIVVPMRFTQKALTYDTFEPERAYLEYVKSNKLSQSGVFKADLVAKVLKETANKTLVETFTLNIFKTMQKMQEHSLEIIDNEVMYQKKYKENIENPMQDAMKDFDQRLSEMLMQHAKISQFDSYIKVFDTNVKDQTDKENQNVEHFILQREKAEKTTELFSKWSSDYADTVKEMNEDLHRKSLIDLQKAGVFRLQDVIDTLKAKAIRVELYKRKLQDDQKKIFEIKKGYDLIANEGAFEPGIFNGSEETKETVISTLNDVDQWIGDTNSFFLRTTAQIDEVKTNFENQIAKTCESLPSNLSLYAIDEKYKMEKQIIPFCTRMGIGMDQIKGVTTKIKRSQLVILDAKTTNVQILSNLATARYRFSGESDEQWRDTFPQQKSENAVVEMEIVAENRGFTDGKTSIDIEVMMSHGEHNTTMKIPVFDGTNAKVLLEANDRIKAIVKLEMLINLYYGENIEVLSKEVAENKTVTNFLTLRSMKKYENTALIEKLSVLLDKDTLKKEVTKMLAGELSKIMSQYIEEMNQYIIEVSKLSSDALDESQLGQFDIYTDSTENELKEPKVEYYIDREATEIESKSSLNYVIAKIEEQQARLGFVSQQLSVFDEQFTKWLEQCNKISTTVGTIVEMRNDEGQISVDLEKNQIDVLKGVDELQKSIANQLTYTQTIMKDAEQLKTVSNESVEKIKVNTEKLEATKKDFDTTISNNSELVESFVHKYASAQSGGADNSLFYHNYANPVGLTEKVTSNINNLTAFFMIMLTVLFSFLIARCFSEYRSSSIARKLKIEHSTGSKFSGLIMELSVATIVAIIGAVSISFIGLQSLPDLVNIDKMLVNTIISTVLVTLVYLFSVILFVFRKQGTKIIVVVIALYFLTNGALGLALVKNASFSWLRFISPFNYVENILQSVLLIQVAPVSILLIILAAIMIISVVGIYLVQLRLYKEKQ